ncbi:MAG: ABC transporter substrate-binding protein, partial [Bacteroidota bacterium]
FLSRLFDDLNQEASLKIFEPNIVRLAITLPFYWDNTSAVYNGQLPRGGVTSLEFYEGFKIAVEEYADSMNQQVFLRLFDSRRDTNQVNVFLNDMLSFRPTLIVGDYYNNESKVISAWADSFNIPQVIPFSPTSSLVQDRAFSFLAHPSVFSHGARLAEYAWYNQGLTRVAVFSDGSSSTQELADGFSSTFTELGGVIDTMDISPNYETAVDQIPDQVRRIVNDGSGVGVYIPLMGNEEAAGLIINLLRQRAKDVAVMGSPHFRTRYNTLSRDIKEYYQVLFTTSHLLDTEEEAYRNLYRQYLKEFYFPPSANVVQGYDLGKFLLRVIKDYDPSLGATLDNYLRIAPKFQGLHIDYHFDSNQSNQSVNIGQYTAEGVVKVN